MWGNNKVNNLDSKKVHLDTPTLCLLFVPEEEELYLLETLVVISVILSFYCSVK